MVNVSIARRYARALIEVAAETNQLDAVAQQLNELVRVLRASPELEDVLTNPAYTRAQKGSVMEAVLKAMGTAVIPGLASALRLMVDRNRTSYLPDIARLYRDMADVKAGRLRAKVTSAVKLPVETLTQLKQSLETATQRHIEMEHKEDPALLGGVSAQVGSVVYDASIRSQLEELRRTLSGR